MEELILRCRGVYLSGNWGKECTEGIFRRAEEKGANHPLSADSMESQLLGPWYKWQPSASSWGQKQLTL